MNRKYFQTQKKKNYQKYWYFSSASHLSCSIDFLHASNQSRPSWLVFILTLNLDKSTPMNAWLRYTTWTFVATHSFSVMLISFRIHVPVPQCLMFSARIPSSQFPPFLIIIPNDPRPMDPRPMALHLPIFSPLKSLQASIDNPTYSHHNPHSYLVRLHSNQRCIASIFRSITVQISAPIKRLWKY